MHKIGNKELVYTRTFLIPEGDDLWLTPNVAGWNLKINIKFQDGDKQEVKIKPVAGHAEITLVKWNNALGTAITEPSKIGVHQDGRVVYFLLANQRIGSVNKLDIELLLGGAK